MADSERTVTDDELLAKGERIAAARRERHAALSATLPDAVVYSPCLGAPWDYGPGRNMNGKQFIGGA
jgi:hypothetical protein